MHAYNILRENDKMNDSDWDLSLVNNILSITRKRITEDCSGYYNVNTDYYKLSKINFEFLRSERFCIVVINKILTFIK